MTGDAELREFRLGYYRLFVALLAREPEAAVLAALAEGATSRAEPAGVLDPSLGAGWREVAAFLDATPRDQLAETVQDEYTRLFLGPFDPEVHPYESWYLTGRVLDRPLAAVRQSLRDLRVALPAGSPEPEDFLAVELDVMRRLLERQGEAADPDAEARCVDAQATFLARHLLVWGPLAARDLAAAKGAVFYRGVGHLLEGFLNLEREHIEGWGGERPVPLEDARARFAGAGEWKGPLFGEGPTAPPER